MADAGLSGELLLEAMTVFRAGDRRDDPAAALALFRFLRLVETDGFAPAQVREVLGNDTSVSGYIEKVRTELKAQTPGLVADLAAGRAQLLEAIHADTRQTLEVQQLIHGDVQRLNTAAGRLEQATRQTEADTKILSGMISSVMRNTSTRSAFAIGLAVGVLAGVPVNLGTSALYERYFSVDAWKGKRPETPDGAPPAPLPSLIEPWPPIPPTNPGDITTWFRQNQSYTFAPTPAHKPTPAAPARAAHHVSRAHPPSRHTR